MEQTPNCSMKIGGHKLITYSCRKQKIMGGGMILFRAFRVRELRQILTHPLAVLEYFIYAVLEFQISSLTLLPSIDIPYAK